MGPLEGLRVVDMSRMVPGAFCTLLLADLGAEVLKIETPKVGDGLRGLGQGRITDASHLALNRGKRSIVVDLRHPGAAAVLKRIVDQAQVVVESHRPGQLDGRNLGYQAMKVGHPELVWCSITGFGEHGPNSNVAGHDLTYLGYSGLLARLSDAGSKPTPPRTTISLPFAALTAAVGILAAVVETRQTGAGSKIDINMTDSAMWVLSEEIARTANTPGPGWGTSAARNVYSCSDGRLITVAANDAASWKALCDAVGADNPSEGQLAELFLAKPASDWLAHPGPAGGVGPVNEVADLLDDPQLTERESLVTLAGSAIRVLANPVRYDEETGAGATHATTPPPQLGEHTDDVLQTVGYTQDEIDELRSAGTVA